MEADKLYNLLEKVYKQDLSPGEALKPLKNLYFEDIEYAKIDHHRTLRTGYPEVIFCEGKTTEQVIEIMKRLVENKPGKSILATRAGRELYQEAEKVIPGLNYNEQARIMYVRSDEQINEKGSIVVVSAGTGDIPVSEEAALTAELMGGNVQRLYDVGVAGLHRLLAHIDVITSARVIVAVAGMEGALPSVIGGLVDKPVIAVPTSIGYGANLNGISALLGMLNSCAPGVTVVNIDNGFGAGYAAVTIAGANGN